MKSGLFLLGAILLFSVKADSQSSGETFFSLKSIPAEGLLLDQGWTFYRGDDSSFAKLDSKINHGIPVNPALLLDQLPAVRRAGIGWFRLKLRVDTSLINKTVGINLSMLGAAEIYLNGERIYQFGRVSTDYKLEKTQAMYGQIFDLKLNDNSEQLLAVRYSYHPHNLYFKIGSIPFCLSITLRTKDENVKYFGSYVKQAYFFAGVALCIEITAALLTLYFFFSFPLRKEYLYFGLFFSFQFFGIVFQIDFFGIGKTLQFTANELFLLCFLEASLLIAASIFLFNGIYALFKMERTRFYWFLVFYVIIGLAAVPFLPDWGGLIAVLFFPFSCFEILPIYYRGMRNGFRGARILFLSIAITFLLLLVMVKATLENNLALGATVVSISLLTPALGLMIFLAVDFARTSLSLQSRVVEVEDLSKKTIAQEKEKQEILSDQKNKLEEEVQERTAELSKSLRDLKSTQTQLIQSEKMASLGELTAGIAHEIQNPLNFVNNFSDLNTELVEELKTEAQKGNKEEVIAIANDIKANQEKINHHGKRADAIVKGMLLHSQTSNGQKEPTDINKLADEYLRLSYHGLRSKDNSFNATLKTDFDKTMVNINVIPQDIGRVLLNLINNAFYAVSERHKANGLGYEPVVSISTKKNGEKVEIRVTDNGNGIPEKVLGKIFQPFFTTKPTGQGTGLGLSLSYDIVKALGGEIKVKTKEWEGSEFVVQLPVV